MSSNKTIVWFRRDLRIEDNPALAAASRDGSVFPVYIWCPKEEGQFYPGRVSRWWLKHSLAHLGHSLKSLGADLVLIKTQSTLAALLDCINAIRATKVVFNHLYDPISLVRDHQIKEKLVELGISVQSFNGDLLYEPWEIYDEKGYAFTTFDAYWGKCLHMQMEPVSLLPPWRLVPATGAVEKCSIEELGLEDESEKSSNALLGRGWSPGWSNADVALTQFVEQHLLYYSENRLKVGGNATSLLSPYLHFGEISVRKVFHCVRMKQILCAKEKNFVGEESVALFLRAIGLREYSRYICFNFPFTHERSLLRNLKYFPWNADLAHFKSWRQGRTGYPLVDAGMRELWATGWTHNRIRVIVSSFAVKILLLPWKWGMKYFWDTLLDADIESDILGWQYISGSLPDGHELERLDSPEIQGSKFDPDGDYVRHWLPELARMPTEWIHHPWDAPLTVLKVSGVELGLNYPKPIIDLDVAREHLREAIFKMWEMEAAERAANSNGTDEVVDDSDSIATSPIPKVVLKERTNCATLSSKDQRVPCFSNCNNDPFYKKRSKCMEEERPHLDQAHNRQSEAGPSVADEDLCSTAESSAAKKQATSRTSFSVPQSWSSSVSKPLEESEYSDLKHPSQEDIDMGQDPSKDGEPQS
ncbi:DNA_photolyase domain-containing protein/FAD_binding_7 domain-containing protein [Cephalotus follicularis]|uniref:DNA_photolyase domain-containing protein/FAD_binding_7 domain-containing protein n=1 Tax=Cephalotus follicularis TaxID=3775 RepID=A0A1Q3B8P8_CEPFO|nr:DNA_photolyase domain-containing protein/FAD_binding_7 domain-containing protein [Cephalotus follicularis]